MWEVRASPPRTNCPVTLLLQNEEPRAVSPLTKKNRDPKRRIDFKDDKQVEMSTPDNNGTASWADMVRNGHRRVSQSSSGASSPSLSQRNTIDSKDNGAKKENRERSSKEMSLGAVCRNKTDTSGKDSKESSIADLSHKTSSSNSTYQSVKSSTSSKILDETTHHSVIENSRKSSVNSDKKLSTETSSLEEDIDREHLKEDNDDEGWEVVSRGRGKPLRKPYNRVQSVATAGPTDYNDDGDDKNFSIKEKRSECVDLDDGESKVNHDDDQVDYDVNEDVDGDWQYHHTSVAMEISDSDGKDILDNRNNSPGTADCSNTDEPGVQVC